MDLGAIGYMTVFAYAVALIVNQLGLWFGGNGLTAGTVVALAVLAALLYLLLRKNPYDKQVSIRKGVAETC
jgi:ferrous iron transport protein B